MTRWMCVFVPRLIKCVFAAVSIILSAVKIIDLSSLSAVVVVWMRNKTCWMCDMTHCTCDMTRWMCDMTHCKCDMTRWICDMTHCTCDMTRWMRDMTRWMCDMTQCTCDMTHCTCDMTRWMRDMTRWMYDMTQCTCDMTHCTCDMTRWMCDMTHCTFDIRLIRVDQRKVISLFVWHDSFRIFLLNHMYMYTYIHDSFMIFRWPTWMSSHYIHFLSAHSCRSDTFRWSTVIVVWRIFYLQ